jgi:uncharacterized phage protein gp47/JayE
MPAILDANGLQIKTLAEILADFVTRARSEDKFGPGVSTGPKSILGHLFGIAAEGLSKLYDLLRLIYDSILVDNAQGAGLENVVAYTGLTREEALPSSGFITLIGDTTTVVPILHTSKVPLGPLFDTQAATTIPPGIIVNIDTVDDTATYTVTLIATPFAYVAMGGDGVKEILEGLQALIDFSGLYNAFVKDDVDLLIRRDDRAAFASAVGATGAGAISQVLAKGHEEAVIFSQIVGPIEAGAGAITEIVDAFAGLDSVINKTAVVLGVLEETDTALRARHQRSFQLGGCGTDHSTRAKLEQLDDVTAAVVISNRSEIVDVFGSPPKTFLSVLWPPTADKEQIALTIFGSGPSGIDAVGSESVIITDKEGHSQTVKFSFATTRDIWIEVAITPGTDYPVDGDDQVEAAVLDFASRLSVGDDVYPFQIGCWIADKVTGVLEAIVEADFTFAPTTTTPLVIALDEISAFDAVRITVSS